VEVVKEAVKVPLQVSLDRPQVPQGLEVCRDRNVGIVQLFVEVVKVSLQVSLGLPQVPQDLEVCRDRNVENVPC
jgi:hypothetical protein